MRFSNLSIILRALFSLAIIYMLPLSALAQCPEVEAIMVNACGTEHLNEFVIIHSGGGFNVDDLQLDFDPSNNTTSNGNHDININPDSCGLATGLASVYTGCTNVIPVGPGFSVPANAILVLQTSSGANANYDFSGLCGDGECIYVIANSCTRERGAFTNNHTGTRTTTFSIEGQNCTQTIVINGDNLPNVNGDYYLPLEDEYGNDGCVAPPSSPATDPVAPTFTNLGPYCQGATPGTLPTTSNNGFSGTWNPAIINTTAAGSFDYVFTPAPGQCADTYTMTIVINEAVEPTFNPVAELCQDSTPPSLPGTSLNNIQGTWNPAVINTSSPGSFTYTFTPNTGQCATTTTLQVQINAPVTPVFSPIANICQNNTAPALPSTSTNGISGTWNPTTINTSTPGTYTFTFTPNAGQCATTATIDVTILARPTGYLSGIVDLCPGECGSITFALTGGSGLYNLQLSATVGSFTLPFPAAGVTNNSTFTICYTGTLPFPQFQPPATLIVPLSAPPSSITFNLLSITDANGGPCPAGVVQANQSSITLRARPTANNAQLTVCDDNNDGTGIFNLTNAESTVKGNNNSWTVSWFSDSGLNNAITNPTAYSATNGTIVYAVVTNEFGCTDDSQVTLLVEAPDTPQLDTYTICITAPPLNLPTNINGVMGSWSGPNVSNNQFNPSGLSEGTYTITFTPNPGQCYIAATTTVEVTSGGPIPLQGIPDIICVGENILELPATPNNTTGIWSTPSPHLNGNQFNLVNAGPGVYVFTFTPNDPNSCFLPNQATVEVIPNADLTAPDFPDICQNTGFFDLGNEVNGVGGNWGGINLVSNNRFNTDTDLGTYVIVFTPEDVCTNPVEAAITIIPSATITLPSFPDQCPDGMSFPLPETVEGVPGTWYVLGNNISEFDPSLYGTGTIELTFIPEPGLCYETGNTFVMVGSVSAGVDFIDSLCTSTPLALNLENYLSAFADNNGSWYSKDTLVARPDSIPISSLINGKYTFLYVVPDPVCGNDTARFVFHKETLRKAGNSGNLTVCSKDAGSVNFAQILMAYNAGGIWTNTRNLNLNLTNPVNVDLSSLPSGNTVFSYRFDRMICPGDTAEIDVQINPFNSAGTDAEVSVCVGSVIDLKTTLQTTFTGGIFEDNMGYGGLNGSEWNAAGKNPGQYTFLYITPGDGACPKDTAKISVNLAQSVSAGNDIQKSFCAGESFVPGSYLPFDASPGGQLRLNGLPVGISQEIDGTLPSYTFIYSVGDGITCPKDSAVWVFSQVAKPDIILNWNPLKFCAGTCGELVIGHNAASITPVEFRLANNFTNSFNLIPGIPLRITLCEDNTKPQGFFNLIPGESSIQHIKATVNGCVFDYNASSKVTVLPNPVVQLNKTLCSGQTFKIGSDTYNESKSSGTTVIPGNGTTTCDSTYEVKITFLPKPTGNFTSSTCDQNFSLTIGGKTFNKNNSTGAVVLPGAAKNGCDSTVNVQLIFLQASTPTSFEQNTCDQNFQITIGSQTFGKSNPTGQVLLKNKAGCDSIVNVKLNFLSSSSSTITRKVCDDDFVLTIGSVTFSKSNPTGQSVLSGAAVNGCDSIVNVSLQFIPFTGNAEVIQPPCDSDRGQINISNASLPGPYSLSINNATSEVVNTLPLTRELPAGEYDIILRNQEGCAFNFSAEINSRLAPNINLTSTKLQDGSFQINTEIIKGTIQTFVWQPSASLSCSDCQNPIANPKSTTEYVVDISYGNGCEKRFSITIERQKGGQFVFPNVFKPGTTGPNANFFITSPEGGPEALEEIAIYDRWGQKVFHRLNWPLNSTSDGWDGKFGGVDVLPGVYVLHLVYNNETLKRKETYTGTITVIR